MSGGSLGPPVFQGAPEGFLGPPVTPGGPLGPPGASGYSQGPSGASWGLQLLRGLSGASWGLRLLPGGPLGPPGASGYSRGPFHSPAKPIWRWCGSVRVGAPLGSAGKKRAAPQALLPVDAGPRGRASAPRGRRATAPWACPFSQHREKIGWGSLGICIVAAESCAARWSGRERPVRPRSKPL